MRQLFSALCEDADGVLPVELVTNPARGSRVGSDVRMFVFGRSRVVHELPWVNVVGKHPPVAAQEPESASAEPLDSEFSVVMGTVMDRA